MLRSLVDVLQSALLEAQVVEARVEQGGRLRVHAWVVGAVARDRA
jgi:hypothetical protein